MTNRVHARISEKARAGIVRSFPALKPYQVDRIISKYEHAVLIIIKQHLRLGGSLEGNICFTLREARLDAGRFKYKEQEKWIFTEVDPHARLFRYVRMGVNRHESLTKAKLHEEDVKLFERYFGLPL